jgi:urease accessory protein
MIYVAPDAEARLDTVREAAPDCAASAWNGMLIARILAPDSAIARRTVIAALSVLRDGRPLPRAWRC